MCVFFPNPSDRKVLAYAADSVGSFHGPVLLGAGTPDSSTSLYIGTESLTHSFIAVLGIGPRATSKGKYSTTGHYPHLLFIFINLLFLETVSF